MERKTSGRKIAAGVEPAANIPFSGVKGGPFPPVTGHTI